VAGGGEDRFGRPLLDLPRRIHDVHPIGVAGHDPEVVGDHQERDAEPVRQVAHQLQHLRLDGHIECGGRLVGDQKLGVAGEPDGDHHALAHAAGKLVRILPEPALRIGDPDHAQELDRARLCRLPVHPEMDQERLHELQTDREHRVQRGHGFLEDHGDLPAPHRAHRFGIERCKIPAGKADATAGDAAGGLRQQPHDGERGDRFAGSGFADQGHDLARMHGEAHAFDRPHGAARGDEVNVQVFDLQQRCLMIGALHWPAGQSADLTFQSHFPPVRRSTADILLGANLADFGAILYRIPGITGNASRSTAG
jgi:hypothetical protein